MSKPIVVPDSRLRPRIQLKCGPGRTKQSFGDENNPNKIVAQFRKTGILPLQEKRLQYGDVSSFKSYQDSLNVVKIAQEQFYSLSGKARDFFQNDPVKFLQFVQTPGNEVKGAELGLWKAPPSKQPGPEAKPPEPKVDTPPKA